MLIFIQYPLADIRPFLPVKTGQLHTPSWPAPIPYEEFVRSFGGVRPRRKGGISGWIGENEICDANKAIRYKGLTIFYADGVHPIKLKGAGRHFYSDGLATAKYEVVLRTTYIPKELGCTGMIDLVNHILHQKVRVKPNHNKEPIETSLVSLGKHLAGAYLDAATKHQFDLTSEQTGWVKYGKPGVLISLRHNEPRLAHGPTEEEGWSDVELTHTWLRHSNPPLGLWEMRVPRGDIYATERARMLRIHLVRLYIETECLRLVMKSFENDELSSDYDTMPFDRLQHYFNKATWRINRRTHSLNTELETSDIERSIKKEFEAAFPGRNESLLSKLELIRPQVREKVIKQLNINVHDVTADNVVIGTDNTMMVPRKS